MSRPELCDSQEVPSGSGRGPQAGVRLLRGDTMLKGMPFILEAYSGAIEICRAETEPDQIPILERRFSCRPDWLREKASERLFGRLAVIHSGKAKSSDLFSMCLKSTTFSFSSTFFPHPGVYTCSAQGVWMNEVLGRSQPTCLPGTSLSSSLPQRSMQGTGPHRLLWLLMG